MILSERFWKKYFTVYDLLNELIPYQLLIDRIIHELELFPGARVLDAGSGTGNISAKIKSKSSIPVALDNSEAGLEICKLKIPDVEAYLFDLTQQLPFPEGSFDRVVSNNTLYTIPVKDRLSVTKELYRVLKPGGIIVVADLHKGFSPIKIYTSHISKSLHKFGLFKTVISTVRLFIPTIKIFYFNAIIKAATSNSSVSLLDRDEHEVLMTESGFFLDLRSVPVYSGSSFLAKGHK